MQLSSNQRYLFLRGHHEKMMIFRAIADTWVYFCGVGQNYFMRHYCHRINKDFRFLVMEIAIPILVTGNCLVLLLCIMVQYNNTEKLPPILMVHITGKIVSETSIVKWTTGLWKIHGVINSFFSRNPIMSMMAKHRDLNLALLLFYHYIAAVSKVWGMNFIKEGSDSLD